MLRNGRYASPACPAREPRDCPSSGLTVAGGRAAVARDTVDRAKQPVIAGWVQGQEQYAEVSVVSDLGVAVDRARGQQLFAAGADDELANAIWYRVLRRVLRGVPLIQVCVSVEHHIGVSVI